MRMRSVEQANVMASKPAEGRGGDDVVDGNGDGDGGDGGDDEDEEVRSVE